MTKYKLQTTLAQTVIDAIGPDQHSISSSAGAPR